MEDTSDNLIIEAPSVSGRDFRWRHKFRSMGSSINPLIYMCVIAFGAASWLHVNGIWVELPLLVFALPEGWNLPSYLAVIVQLAIVGPLLYALMEKLHRRSCQRVVDLLIAAMIGFGCVCTIFLILFWNRTVFIGSTNHSVALFIIFFGVSLVDTTSNVTFLPYMGNLQPQYIIAYFIGMGFSALIPSVLALIQGAGHTECVANGTVIDRTTNRTVTRYISHRLPPRFPVEIFFVCLLVSFCLSLVAFCILNWSKYGRLARVDREEGPNEDEKMDPDVGDKESSDKAELKVAIEGMKATTYDSSSTSDSIPSTDTAGGILDSHRDDALPPSTQDSSELPLLTYVILLLLTMWICALMNGVLPPIQSFACLPYGQMIYHIAACLSNIANPVACFVPFFIHLQSLGVIVSLTLLTSAISGYAVAMAAMSPQPLLVGTTVGQALIIIAWILAYGLCAYLRTVMAELLRSRCTSRPRALFWCGAATQAGSFVGAVIMFPLVNIYQLFQSAPMCASL